MHHSIWKLTALAVVVGIGALVVVQAQRNFNSRDQESAENDAPEGEAGPSSERDALISDEGPPAQSEPEPALESSGSDVAVPASAKSTASPQGRTRPPARNTEIRRADELSLEEDAIPSDSRQASSGGPQDDSHSQGRGTPALRLRMPDDETDTADHDRAERDEADENSGPRLLRDRTMPDLKPLRAPASDPFADDESDESSDTTVEQRRVRKDRSVPASSEIDDEPGPPSRAIGTQANESGRADDEMPIIDRAIPRKRAATSLAPAEDSDAGDDPAEFPAVGKRSPNRSGASAPKTLNLPSEGTDDADDIPDAAGVGRPQTMADPFGDEDPEPRTPAARSSRTEESKVDRSGRPDPGFADDDDGIPSPGRKGPTAGAADSLAEDDPAELSPAPVREKSLPRSTPGTEDFPLEERIGDDAAFGRSPPASEGTRPTPPRARRPQLTIEKIAPPTAVLGRPLVYHIVVRNAGATPAREVVVEEAIPPGAKVDGSIPQALLQDKRLIWKLGTLEPGREKKIAVRVVPQVEGTLGSVATVNCAEDMDHSGPPAPQLKIDVAAPDQVVVGTPVAFRFRVTNVGPLDVKEVVIRDVLPAALRHPDGDDLEYVVGPLPAGKARDVELTLTAAQTGRTVNRVIVTADGKVSEETNVTVEVVGPSLRLTRTGTRKLFPGKSGNYTNTVTNPGSGTITGVRVVETVPPGMEFVSASDGGQFDPAKRSVTWTIDRLAAQESRSLRVTLNSAARGAQISVVRAYDASGGSGETVGTTHVAGLPALTIELGEIPALIENGEQFTIPLRLVNRGSDLATNVRASVVLPPGIELVAAKGPVEYRVIAADRTSEPASAGPSRGRSASAAVDVQFQPIASLDARGDVALELSVRARRPGSSRIQVQALCDQLTEPVRREEVTTVVTSEP